VLNLDELGFGLDELGFGMDELMPPSAFSVPLPKSGTRLKNAAHKFFAIW
jgi:hypothetical protein